MKRVSLDDKLFDELIAEESDDPTELVPPDILRLIPGFVERRTKEVISLTQLLAQDRFDAIQEIGQRMKGSADNGGIPLMSTIGAELEIGSQNRDRQRIQESIRQLSNLAAGLEALLTANFNC